MSFRRHNITCVLLFFYIFTFTKAFVSDNSPSLSERINNIINGTHAGEYIKPVKFLLFFVDNFEISYYFWSREPYTYWYFGLSCAYYPLPDIIKINNHCTISFFNIHINFIRFVVHLIRFYFLFSKDSVLYHMEWDEALLTSLKHSLYLNSLANCHFITIRFYNVKVSLFSVINILYFWIGKTLQDVKTNDGQNGINTDNNGANSSFFINPNGDVGNQISFFHGQKSFVTDVFSRAFRGSSHLYLLLYPRIEICFLSKKLVDKIIF